jgi:hypothetical protein
MCRTCDIGDASPVTPRAAHAGVDTTPRLADAPGAQSEAEIEALYKRWQRGKSA